MSRRLAPLAMIVLALSALLSMPAQSQNVERNWQERIAEATEDLLTREAHVRARELISLMKEKELPDEAWQAAYESLSRLELAANLAAESDREKALRRADRIFADYLMWALENETDAGRLQAVLAKDLSLSPDRMRSLFGVLGHSDRKVRHLALDKLERRSWYLVREIDVGTLVFSEAWDWPDTHERLNRILRRSTNQVFEKREAWERWWRKEGADFRTLDVALTYFEREFQPEEEEAFKDKTLNLTRFSRWLRTNNGWAVAFLVTYDRHWSLLAEDRKRLLRAIQEKVRQPDLGDMPWFQHVHELYPGDNAGEEMEIVSSLGQILRDENRDLADKRLALWTLNMSWYVYTVEAREAARDCVLSDELPLAVRLDAVAVLHRTGIRQPELRKRVGGLLMEGLAQGGDMETMSLRVLEQIAGERFDSAEAAAEHIRNNMIGAALE